MKQDCYMHICAVNVYVPGEARNYTQILRVRHSDPSILCSAHIWVISLYVSNDLFKLEHFGHSLWRDLCYLTQGWLFVPPKFFSIFLSALGNSTQMKLGFSLFGFCRTIFLEHGNWQALASGGNPLIWAYAAFQQ